jgi:hypothetical protein
MEKILTITEIEKELKLSVNGFSKIEIIGILQFYLSFFINEKTEEVTVKNNNL